MLLSTIDDVVLACVALHNFRRKTGSCSNDEYDDTQQSNSSSLNFHPDSPDNDVFEDARLIRDYLKDFLQRT